MKKKRNEAEFIPPVEVCVSVGGRDYVVKAKATEIGNSGIGPFECHGTRGFDHGRDFVESWEFLSIVPDGWDGPVDRKAVEKAIDDDLEATDKISEALDDAMERSR